VQWQQRKGLDVVTGSDWMMLPQPVGTTRSIVVLADYWQDPEEVGTTLSGQHDLGIRFHFMPSVWKKELWMGQIDTPSIAIEFPDKR